MTQESLKYLENEPFCGYTDQIHPAKQPPGSKKKWMQYINLFLIRQDVLLSLLEFSMFSLSKSSPVALLEKIVVL